MVCLLGTALLVSWYLHIFRFALECILRAPLIVLLDILIEEKEGFQANSDTGLLHGYRVVLLGTTEPRRCSELIRSHV